MVLGIPQFKKNPNVQYFLAFPRKTQEVLRGPGHRKFPRGQNRCRVKLLKLALTQENGERCFLHDWVRNRNKKAFQKHEKSHISG